MIFTRLFRDVWSLLVAQGMYHFYLTKKSLKFDVRKIHFNICFRALDKSVINEKIEMDKTKNVEIVPRVT